MSKIMMRAFILGQYAALSAKDNKERLRFTVAGIKDGKFYDHVGTDYGVFDKEAPDAIFIPDTDLQLSRITGAKIEGINKKMSNYFTEYYQEDITPHEDKSIDTKADDADDVQLEIDTEAVIVECKKAIKKGNIKKAQKLIDKLDGKAAKKLQKKLDKTQ